MCVITILIKHIIFNFLIEVYLIYNALSFKCSDLVLSLSLYIYIYISFLNHMEVEDILFPIYFSYNTSISKLTTIKVSKIRNVQ